MAISLTIRTTKSGAIFTIVYIVGILIISMFVTSGVSFFVRIIGLSSITLLTAVGFCQQDWRKFAKGMLWVMIIAAIPLIIIFLQVLVTGNLM